ncbi:hypothetical protein, partial [Streptomyces sp. URMC 129]|uniref:alpha/beta fold hydrolase n=1 Tax=Streptomyces sp. URMC 129 TaxID=3423407 RepID=UPI003F1A049E
VTTEVTSLCPCSKAISDYGAHDPLTRGLPDLSHRHADAMTMETVPATGHFIAEERPTWTTHRIADFLSR